LTFCKASRTLEAVLATIEMSASRTLLLGAIAGLTIFLGLPIGRMRNPAPRLRAGLNAVAIGILVFLLFDVLSAANEPVEDAIIGGDWGNFAGYAALFAGGVAIGLIGLVYYDRFMAAPSPVGDALGGEPRTGIASWAPAKRLALLIALGIGLHNFSEGLAIGQSAARGEVSLALALIIGFGMHNATEGFGIVGPMAGEAERPSWKFLIAMGLIGGGPTFLGTVVGRAWVNDAVFIAFLALAAGSILYVIIQLLRVAARHGLDEVVMWGIFLGLVLGFATDYVLVGAGV
jgi:ZIP family zinc transporter